MIKRSDEMVSTVKVNMRGGDGQAVVTDILNKDEYNGHARLIGKILLEPGCSIGVHVHENEEEVFYIIEGTATYDDNGKIETLNAGDSCVCLGGQSHSIANRSEEENLVVFAVILTY
ncbi:MAG: cupin domain-containing protein [Faecalibacterium sp.]|nr:cupin domain-containing protein [Ruminococcus sp.]MCM1391677.1 cupin domain-containing protein [Ruminococcus sp.]MCM1485981.1 cupin domain-containing protein [Faecalibacterium sp.]